MTFYDSYSGRMFHSSEETISKINEKLKDLCDDGYVSGNDIQNVFDDVLSCNNTLCDICANNEICIDETKRQLCEDAEKHSDFCMCFKMLGSE